MRKITVTLEVQDEAAASGIWECHLKGFLLSGCKVVSIAEGDALSNASKYEEVAKNAMDGETEPSGEDIEIGDRTFHSWPFGVYSENDNDPFFGEWYPDEHALRRAYEA